MKTIVVTGASSGIGAAIAADRVAAGWRVLNVDRAAAGRPGVTDIVADLTTLAGIADAADAAARAGAAHFVHCAGAVRQAALADIDLADVDALGQLHLCAPIAVAQAMLPAMRGGGRIVLIASRAVLGVARRSAYAATKAALVGLARTWALELAPLGVTANAVSPGPVETPLFHGVVPAGSEAEARLTAAIPLGRLGRPEDVAGAVAFFLSDGAAWITGQNLFVCGGASVGGTAP